MYLKENTFFICNPPFPKQCRFVDVCLSPTLKKGEGEATFHEGREKNLHPGNKGWSFSCDNVLIMFYSAHVVVYIGFFLNFQISVVFLVSFCWLLGYELGS